MLTRISPALRGGELGDNPLGVVRRPDADAVARLQSERDEPGGECFDVRIELAQVEPHTLLTHHQRGAVGKRPAV